MLLLIEHLQLRGVHFAKCGAQLAAIKVLLDLAKLDRTHDLGRVTTDDAGGYPVFGALVRFKAIAASDQRAPEAAAVDRPIPVPRPELGAALRAGLDWRRRRLRCATTLDAHGACRRARRPTERLDQRGHDAIAATA